MAFKVSGVEDLLVATGRRCCICYSLHNVQVHHLVALHDGGTDDIENAITLCPNCHDQVHGKWAVGRVTRQYTAAELRKHRERTVDQVRQAGLVSMRTGSAAETSVEILRSVLDGTTSLALCLAETLSLATGMQDSQLFEFCERELVGLRDTGADWVSDTDLNYRHVDVYVSLTARLNTGHWHSSEQLFEEIGRDRELRDHFRKHKMLMFEPVSEIEEMSVGVKSLFLSIQFKLGDIISDAVNPNAEVAGYINPSDLRKILGAIRRKLTEHLVRVGRNQMTVAQDVHVSPTFASNQDKP